VKKLFGEDVLIGQNVETIKLKTNIGILGIRHAMLVMMNKRL
jgi:hypothetical protein